MTRALALVCSLACSAIGVAAVPSEAAAERRSAVDRRAGFAFVLEGAQLTVNVRPGAAGGRARREVFGQTITAVCFANYDFARRGRVIDQLPWPTGQDELTFTFARDLSRRAKTCLIEADGGDIAVVSFGPGPALLFVTTVGRDRAGVRSFLRLRDDAGRSLLTKRGRGLTRLVDPGRYRLVSYERRCRRSCRSLGPPMRRCTRRLRLRARTTRYALVRVHPGRKTCRIDAQARLGGPLR